MPTPASGYRIRSGRKIPSVTTIIGRMKDSGGLIHWANRLAYEPYLQARKLIQDRLDLQSDSKRTAHYCDDRATWTEAARKFLAVPDSAADYKHVRDHAAGIGTIVHARVDAHIRGAVFQPAPYVSSDISDPIAASQAGFEAFLEWASGTQFELAEGEIQLVSEAYKYGGTPDVVLVRGQRVVGDWKTGKIYEDQVLPQLAAYRQLLLENGKQVGESSHVISINKKTGGFTHKYFTPAEMAHGWKMFWYMRQLYQLLAELKDGIPTSSALTESV